MSDLPRRVLWTIAGMLTALAIGSLVHWIELRKAPPDVAAARFGSLKTWWMLALLLLAGSCIIPVTFGAHLTGNSRHDRSVAATTAIVTALPHDPNECPKIAHGHFARCFMMRNPIPAPVTGRSGRSTSGTLS